MISLICLAAGVKAFSQVIAIEKFDYDIGTELVNSGLMESGWAGPWAAVTQNANGVVRNDTITNFTLEIRTDLPVVVLPSGGNKVERELADRIEITSDTIWISFISECTSCLAATKASVGLVDYSYASDESVRIELGKTFGSTRVVSDGVSIYPRDLDNNFLFGKFIVAAIVPLGNDSVSVYSWVDPDLDSELIFEDAVFPRIQTMSGIDAVRITVLGDPGDEFRVDDIYLGTDLASVLPTDWVDVDVDDLPQSAYEPFDYTIDEGLNGKAGGKGFTGEWQLLNSFDHNIIAEEIVVSEDFITQAPVLHMEHDAGNTGSRYVRRLQVPVSDDGRSYWFGAVIDVSFTTNGNVAQYFLANIDELGPSGPAGQYLQFGKSFQEDKFAVGVPGNYRTIDNVPAEGVHYIAALVETTGNSQPERIYIWIDPEPEVDEPAISDVDLIMTQEINGGWNALGVKIEGEAGITLKMDDLATGLSYRDIVPDYLISTTDSPDHIAGLSIFPNPGNGRVNLTAAPGFQWMKIQQIEVIDMTGKVVNTIGATEPMRPEVQLIPSGEVSGMYLIRVLTTDSISCLKYIKQ